MTDYASVIAVVHSDLQSLVAAQEKFFADNVQYSTSLDPLAFRPSSGVTVTLAGATRSGWSATATHLQLPRVHCSINVGN